MQNSTFGRLFNAWLFVCLCVEIVGLCIQSETVMIIGAMMLYLPIFCLPIVAVLALGSPFNACKQWEEYR